MPAIGVVSGGWIAGGGVVATIGGAVDEVWQPATKAAQAAARSKKAATPEELAEGTV